MNQEGDTRGGEKYSQESAFLLLVLRKKKAPQSPAMIRVAIFANMNE